MEKPKPRIVIFMEGGLIQEIISDQFVNIVVLDQDVETDEEDERIHKFHDPAGNEYLAFMADWSIENKNYLYKDFVDNYYGQFYDITNKESIFDKENK